MRVRGIFISLIIILMCTSFFLSGCGKSEAPSSAKAITVYSINGIVGTIDETAKTISVTLPSLTNVYSLIATYTTTGVSVAVGATIQSSGLTVNNFISPVQYTITAANGTSVNYTVTVMVNRAWHHPTSLADNISPDGQATFSPQIAMDDNGNAIIVWYQYDNIGNTRIYKSEYRNGTWTHPVSPLDSISLSGYSAFSPKVAMDDNGNAIIVWCQTNNGIFNSIFKSEYRNGTWIHPASITDKINLDGLNVQHAQVAMDNNGNAIIVWHQYDGSNYQIYKSEYRGGIWHYPASLADKINPDGQTTSLFQEPQVAMDNNGNAIIVWYQSDGAYNQIFKSEYRNGTWIHPANLSDNISPNGQTAGAPKVAMDNNGNAIIVWYQSDGAYNQIFKSEYRNGTWIHPANLSDNISPDGQDIYVPQVAMDDNGNAIIVWYQNDISIHWQVFKSEYRNGMWTHPTNLSDNISPDGKDSIECHLAMNNNGNAIIVWTERDGDGNYQVFKSEYRNGTWIHPVNISDNFSPDGYIAEYPRVAIDSYDNAIIVWYQSDGTYNQIFKSEYR